MMVSGFIRDSQSFVRELSEYDFRTLMTRDAAFCDYFSKFCSLPIFGQKAAYSKCHEDFIFDPPLQGLKRTQQISKDIVLNWMFESRFQAFSRSRVADEYKLCALLVAPETCEIWLKEGRNKENTNYPAEPENGKTLLQNYICGLSKMAKFREFVSSSKYAEHLIAFWMDAEQLRRISSTESEARNIQKKILHRGVQNKYYRSSSKFFLTAKLLRFEFSARRRTEYRLCDFKFTMELQDMVLKILQRYWIPRYAIHIERCEIVDQALFTHWQSFTRSKCDLDEEQRMLQHTLKRSTMVRLKTNPTTIESAPVPFQYGENDSFLKEDEREEECEDIRSESYLSSTVSDGFNEKCCIDGENLEAVNYLLMPKSNEILNRSATSTKTAFTESQQYAATTKPVQVEQKGWALDETDSSFSLEIFDLENSEDEETISAKKEIVKKRESEADYIIEEETWGKFRSETEFNIISSQENMERTSDSHLPPMKNTISKVLSSSFQTTNELSLHSDVASSNINSKTSERNLPNTFLNQVISPQYSMASQQRCNLSYSDVSAKTDKVHFLTDYDAVFAEILTSDELSGFVYRSFLASCSPEEQSYYGNSSTSLPKSHQGIENELECGKMTAALDFWRDIDDYRRTLSSLESHEIKQKHEIILQRYFATNSLGKFVDTTYLKQLRHLSYRRLTHGDHCFLSTKLLEIQIKIQKILQRQWMTFAFSDREAFQSSVRPMVWKFLKRRNSFPKCSDEMRENPISRVDAGKEESSLNVFLGENESADEDNTLRRFIGFNQDKRMKYRSSRAVRLLLICVRSAPRPCGLTYNGVEADADSDSDGSVIDDAPKKRYSRFPDINGKALARNSAKEYPRPGIDYNKFKSLKIIEQTKSLKPPIYMRPINKGGICLERPKKKPNAFKDVLLDPVHLVFFERFMRLRNAEMPLLFWKKVDLLAKTNDADEKQKKAIKIQKKFFGKASGAGGMLQCCRDEFLKGLAKMDNVTVPMLTEAQKIVYDNMQETWGQRYLNTFREEIETRRNTNVKKATPLPVTVKGGRLWRALGDFIRRAANFLKLMKTPSIFEEFREYLKKIPHNKDLLAMGDASSSSEMHVTSSEKQLDSNATKGKILGKEIILEYLQNDLLFWMEFDRFNILLENSRSLLLRGCHDQSDHELVLQKANTIINCFFDSAVLPKLRVNVEPEIGENILEAYNAGEIDRGLFHDAILATFPTLLVFWKKHCQAKHCYTSKKSLREKRHQDAKRKREALSRLREKKLGQLVSISNVTYSPAPPDYVNKLDGKGTPFERVKGVSCGRHPTLNFTLKHGLRLLIPPPRTGDDDSADGDSLKPRSSNPINTIMSKPKVLEKNNKERAPVATRG